jgi:hypothetical protein
MLANMDSTINSTTNPLTHNVKDPQLTESVCTFCHKLVNVLFRKAILLPPIFMHDAPDSMNRAKITSREVL